MINLDFKITRSWVVARSEKENNEKRKKTTLGILSRIPYLVSGLPQE